MNIVMRGSASMLARWASTAVSGDSLSTRLVQIVSKTFPTHPFLEGVREENEKSVWAHYGAVVSVFPLIQETAAKNMLLNRVIEKNAIASEHLLQIEKEVEVLLTRMVNERVLDIAMLQWNIRRIIGEEVRLNFGYPTCSYLSRLRKDLASKDLLLRIASMVAFEFHIGQMKQVLWHNLARRRPTLELGHQIYFHNCVDGDDSDEGDHKRRIEKFIDVHIGPEDASAFTEYFLACHRDNIAWCKAICDIYSYL